MASGKKTGGLAGVTAGETHLCTVGKEGAGLTYRGYDIYDLADNASFEEVAHLLLHGTLPTQAELDTYIAKIKKNRGLPEPLRAVLEMIPADAHPMDVLRTGVSFLGNIEPEGDFRIRTMSLTACWLACHPCCCTGTGIMWTVCASTPEPMTTASRATSCTCCTTRRRRSCTAKASIQR